MISDLDRLVRVLDRDIALEEERAQVSDTSNASYPILARMLAARRDNLKDTIATLERRLVSLLDIDPQQEAAELARRLSGRTLSQPTTRP